MSWNPHFVSNVLYSEPIGKLNMRETRPDKRINQGPVRKFFLNTKSVSVAGNGRSSGFSAKDPAGTWWNLATEFPFANEELGPGANPERVSGGGRDKTLPTVCL